jgi:flagellar motility protein MotE (MotC chaperone)
MTAPDAPTAPAPASPNLPSRQTGELQGPVDPAGPQQAVTEFPKVQRAAPQQKKARSATKDDGSQSKGATGPHPTGTQKEIYPPPPQVKLNLATTIPPLAEAKGQPLSGDVKKPLVAAPGSEAPAKSDSKVAKDARDQPVPSDEPLAGSMESGAKPVQSYCVNITNSALDARYLRQKKQLEDLKSDLQNRTTDLEGKIAEYKDWLARRDEFASKAQDSLVAIYGNMKGETAAKQIVELEDETASSVLAKLDSRQSSSIIGEMEPKKAARLMEIIAGASKLPMEQPARQSDAPPGEPSQKSDKSISTQ